MTTGDLDLVVVSDFAGVDVYSNDGKGKFTEVTATWVPDSHAFGMAHTLADFNRDGRLDLLMIGMTSPCREPARASRPDPPRLE
jgi:FG-GAP repeat.